MNRPEGIAPIVIPELIIKSILDGIIVFLSKDLKACSRQEDTMLYSFFGKLKYGNFSYFEQAAKLFSISTGKARQLKTKLAFDGDMSEFPIIYVTTGSDDYASAGLGRIDGESVKTSDNLLVTVNWCRFKGMSNMIFMSNSNEEVQLMYHTVRAMFLSVIDTLSLSGIENCKLGGADVALADGLVPKGVYMKAMSLGYEYDIRALSVIHSKGGIALEFGGVIGTPIPEDDFGNINN